VFNFFFHKIVKKIIGWKYLVLIFSLLITPLFILGCTCSKDEEPQVEQQSKVEQPTEKPEAEKKKEIELKPVEIPKSVESPEVESSKESYTEEPEPESARRDEADQHGSTEPTPTPEVTIKTIPGGENPYEKEYGIGPEEREEFERQLAEPDPCSQECLDEFKLCQEDCRQEVHPDEVPSCISDCTNAVIDCSKKCQANQ
jgi:hypothetical protein